MASFGPKSERKIEKKAKLFCQLAQYEVFLQNASDTTLPDKTMTKQDDKGNENVSDKLQK